MANAVLGMLGQATPSTNTDTALYGPGSTRRATISTLLITNTSTSSVKVRVYARMDGAAAATSNIVVPDVTLNPSGQEGCMLPLTIGITLDGSSGDALSVRSDTAGVNFTAFGIEEDLS